MVAGRCSRKGEYVARVEFGQKKMQLHLEIGELAGYAQGRQVHYLTQTSQVEMLSGVRGNFGLGRTELHDR